MKNYIMQNINWGRIYYEMVNVKLTQLYRIYRTDLLIYWLY